jgi:hypothetical protein
MKNISLILLFILVGYKSQMYPQRTEDEFEKNFRLKKTNDPKELIRTLGEPERIDKNDPITDQYYFPLKKDQLPIKVFVNKKENKITKIALTYLVRFDAYAYLKKRFKVEIPELGMTFQYNNEDPFRQPTWIFFK